MLTILHVLFWIMIGSLLLAILSSKFSERLLDYIDCKFMRIFRCPHCRQIVNSVEQPKHCWHCYEYNDFEEVFRS